GRHDLLRLEVTAFEFDSGGIEILDGERHLLAGRNGELRGREFAVLDRESDGGLIAAEGGEGRNHSGGGEYEGKRVTHQAKSPGSEIFRPERAPVCRHR